MTIESTAASTQASAAAPSRWWRRGNAPSTMDGIFETNCITSLRLFFALLVVWSHSFAIYYGTEAAEPVSVMLRGLYNAGNIGVAAFLILSGLLVTASWERRRSTADFAAKRIRRIYPGYMAATLISGFVVVPLLLPAMDWSRLMPGELAKSIGLNLLLRNYIPFDPLVIDGRSVPVNGSLWSIPYEAFCYVGLALGGLILRKRLALACVLGILIATAAKLTSEALGLYGGGGILSQIFGWPYLWFSVGNWFLTGAVFFYARRHIPRDGRLAALAALAIAAIVWLPADPATAKVLCNLFFVPLFAYILFWAAGLAMPRLETITRRFDLSYGAYLYAFPIQQLVFTAYGTRMPFPLYVPLCGLLSMGAGFASWTFVERRFAGTARKGRESVQMPRPEEVSELRAAPPRAASLARR